MNSGKLQKWYRWLGDATVNGSIAHELANLAVIREVHAGLRQMVDQNKELQIHSAFYSVTEVTYMQTVLMYIRRQVRDDKDCISLMRLAREIGSNCGQITKEFYSAMYAQRSPDQERQEWKSLGEQDFAKYFGGSVGDSLDPHLIQDDIGRMEGIVAACSQFVDWRIAHLDKREPTRIPVHSEIESWCQVLNDIFRKYVLLLRAVEYRVEPILQHDWKAIFRKAWR